MTAMRIVVSATLTVLWLAAAWLLWRTEVPEDLHTPALSAAAVFGAGQIARSERYARLLRVDLVLETVAQLLVLVWLARRRLQLRGPALLRAAGLGAIVYVALWLVRLPFALASLWWEHRHGVTHLGALDLVAGDWVGVLAGIALAATAAVVVVGFARAFGRRWWLAAWAALVALAFAWTLVTPYLAPRLEPLHDRELTTAIQSLARREGLGPTEVEVQRTRSRSREVNAEAVGAGPTTKVILWDTLLRPGVSRGEVLIVSAHELAHVARRHVLKGVGWFALLALPCAWVLARTTRLADPVEVPRAALVAALLALALLPLANTISRRYEREADWIALRMTNDPAADVAIMRRFQRTSLVDPEPPRLWHLIVGTHPTLLERVELARSWPR